MNYKTKQRALGCFIGLAIGDALGAPVEFAKPGSFEPITQYRSGGPFNLPAGYWTDDTSMALCLAQSIIDSEGNMDLYDQLDKYVEWYRNGKYSSTGECFDIGTGTACALEDYIATGEISAQESSLGNGSLMRLAPVPILFYSNLALTQYMSRESAITTHGDDAAYYTGLFGEVLAMAILGYSKSHLKVHGINLKLPVRNGGHYMESLRSAMYCFHNTETFEDCVLKAVNMGEDADTVGAIAGQIAGAYYSLDEIPSWMVNELYESEYLLDMAGKIIDFARG